MNENKLHFSFGSPQDFISQARRTRDLWAGSYIMSYLAGVAMHELEPNKDQNIIIFPYVKNDTLMQAIREKQMPAEADPNDIRVGSLPNRFSANVKDGAVCVSAINSAWKNIADKVYEKIKVNTNGRFTEETEKIWKEQVKDTWDFAWVIDENHSLLNSRKCLRTHFPDGEPGEKCAICGEWQALSNKNGSKRSEVKEWWENVTKSFNGANHGKEGNGLHFREDGSERLCAICAIKRVFPLIAKDAIGWELPHNYPSTSYLSAIDWIIHLLDKVTNQQDENSPLIKKLNDFLASAKDACNKKQGQGETATKIKNIHKLVGEIKENKSLDISLLEDLDGDFYFPDAIRNEKAFLTHLNRENSKNDAEYEKNKKKRDDVLNALNDLLNETDKLELNRPTPFYAILAMDGDGMGNLLRNEQHVKESISGALSTFTKKVPKIIDNNGLISKKWCYFPNISLMIFLFISLFIPR